MIVYVIKRFTDYESSQIIKAFKHKKDALAFCSEEIIKIHDNDFHKEKIEGLPTGYRTGDKGCIYVEMKVE